MFLSVSLDEFVLSYKKHCLILVQMVNPGCQEKEAQSRFESGEIFFNHPPSCRFREFQINCEKKDDNKNLIKEDIENEEKPNHLYFNIN